MKQRYPTTSVDQTGLPLPCPRMKQGTPFYPIGWNRNTLYYHIKWSRVIPPPTTTTPWMKQGCPYHPLDKTGYPTTLVCNRCTPYYSLGWNMGVPTTRPILVKTELPKVPPRMKQRYTLPPLGWNMGNSPLLWEPAYSSLCMKVGPIETCAAGTSFHLNI